MGAMADEVLDDFFIVTVVACEGVNPFNEEKYALVRAISCRRRHKLWSVTVAEDLW